MTQDSDALENLLGVRRKPRGKLQFEFIFWDSGESLTEEAQRRIYWNSVRELYSHLTGKDPKDVEPKAIFAGIKEKLQERAGGEVDVAFTFRIVRIDRSNPTQSFVRPMAELNQFLLSSKQRFLSDAIMHLAKLNNENSSEAQELKEALSKAQADGHLNDKQKSALALVTGSTRTDADDAESGSKRSRSGREAIVYESGPRSDYGR